MQRFEYHRPSTLEDALGLASSYGADARVLAGGTDLLVGLRHRAVSARAVIDIKRINDLPPLLHETPTSVVVGATATYHDLIQSDSFVRSFPALVDAMQVVGSVQIRNRGTLVGNSCHASPAADTVPALLVHDAVVLVAGAAGTREIPMDEFIQGPRRTALAEGEIAIAIRIPKPKTATGTAFSRMTRRRGVDLATINLYCSVDDSGETRFSFGAVGPRAFVAVDHTGQLANTGAETAVRSAALDRMLEHASPISDVRASDEYRWAMLRVLSQRALQAALTRLDDASNTAEER